MRGCDGGVALQPCRWGPARDAERARLRGVPRNRLTLGASPAVPDLRPCRLLRRLAEPPRDQAFPYDAAPDYRGLRPAGRLGMVLCRRDLPRSRREYDAAARADSALRLSGYSSSSPPGFMPRARR